jgi:hypothetical protein
MVEVTYNNLVNATIIRRGCSYNFIRIFDKEPGYIQLVDGLNGVTFHKDEIDELIELLQKAKEL